jgi:dTDP-glucose 4,6-dehydratase
MGSEEDLTIAELARRVAETVQSTAEVRIADRPIPGKLPERYVPSTRRARTELGLQQYIDLPEAIRRTISWYKEFFTRE